MGRLGHCSYCRKTKPIVKAVRVLRYCEDCQIHAPTKAQYDAYYYSHSRVSTVEWKSTDRRKFKVQKDQK